MMTSHYVINLGSRTEVGLSPDRVLFSQDLRDIGVGIFRISEDQGLGALILASLDTGGQQSSSESLGAEITLLDHAFGAGRKIGSDRSLDERPRVPPIETP
jgi:hypothetical protein